MITIGDVTLKNMWFESIAAKILFICNIGVGKLS